MRWFIVTVTLLALTPSNIQAETMYISDIMEITLRTGPGRDNKIITMISSGQKVEILRRAENWSKIRMTDGKEGWVLNRFLTVERSNRLKLKALEKEYEALKVKSGPLIEEKSRLKKENARLSAALAARVQETETLKEEVEKLARSERNRWLIVGACIFLAGMLMGLSLRRKRRSPSLR
ncbi:MAG: TIGR04211 family SH3 domain-containing protein [Desulfobacterales bacterium]|nr:TIGR04211 family SH3 domain-containing protein [Desulfobacterales bacterium]